MAKMYGFIIDGVGGGGVAGVGGGEIFCEINWDRCSCCNLSSWARLTRPGRVVAKSICIFWR